MSAAGDAVGQMAQDSCGAQTVRFGDSGAAAARGEVDHEYVECVAEGEAAGGMK